MKRLPKKFFEADAVTLAAKLLGKIIKKGSCLGRIVEVEAYGTDPASHAYKITPRSVIMRDTYGVWYVYFTYGMHYCANITCDKDGIGAVLIRAVEPLEGIELMEKRRRAAKAKQARGISDFAECELPSAANKESVTLQKTRFPSASLLQLTNGPAKFCQAFGVTKKENGLSLSSDFGIYDAPPVSKKEIATGPRIGISTGLELPWRFYLKNNDFVST